MRRSCFSVLLGLWFLSLALVVPAAPARAQDEPTLARIQALLDEGKSAEALPLLDQILETKPDDVEALRLHGQTNQTLGYLAESEGSLRKLVELRPEDGEAWLWLGYTCFYSGEENRLDTMRRSASYIVTRYKDAVAAFEKAVALRPENATAWVGLGLSYFYIPEFEKAEEIYKRGIEKLPRAETGELHYLLGNLYRQFQGEAQKAIPVLEAATEINPKRPEIHLELAEARFASGDTPGGSTALLASLKLLPSYQAAYDTLWRVYGQEKLYEQAQAFFDQAEEAGIKDPKIPWYRGYFAIQAESWDTAIEAFQEALRQNPAFDTAHTLIATAYEKQGKIEEAADALEKALKLNPTNESAKSQLVGLARGQGGAGEYELALELFDRIVVLFPEDATFQADRALTFANLGRTDEAIVAYRQAMVLDPLDTRIVNDLALVHEGLRQFDEAIRLYEQAEEAARDLDAMENLGVLHYKFGKVSEAQRQFAKVLKIDPNRERSLYMFHKCLRNVPRLRRQQHKR